MTKRNLFAELQEGMDALAADRVKKEEIKTLPFDSSKYLDGTDTITVYLREALGSGDDTLIDAALADIEKVARARPIKTKAEYP